MATAASTTTSVEAATALPKTGYPESGIGYLQTGTSLGRLDQIDSVGNFQQYSTPPIFGP